MCYVICCDIIETVKRVQRWLRSWKDYYPFIQSTCMHTHIHTLTDASTKRAITFMVKERAIFAEIDNVLSPCPHIQPPAPGHSIKAFPCQLISLTPRGARQPRYWSRSQIDILLTQMHNGISPHWSPHQSNICSDWYDDGVDAVTFSNRWRAQRCFFFLLCVWEHQLCVKGYERNIGCMREIISPRFWESKYREVCACKTRWEMLTLYSCVGEELFLFFILCTVESFTSFE